MNSDETTTAEAGTNDKPVTISAPPAASVTIDPQNPLPEPNFLWRRVFAGFLGLFACFLAWYSARDFAAAGDMDRLYGLTRLVIYGAGLVITYYFVAPSASELTNMIQTASIMRHSIGMAASAQAEQGKTDRVGIMADETPQNRAERQAGGRFGASPAPDSQIPVSAPGGPLAGDLGGSADSGEVDAAPTGRA